MPLIELSAFCLLHNAGSTCPTAETVKLLLIADAKKATGFTGVKLLFGSVVVAIALRARWESGCNVAVDLVRGFGRLYYAVADVFKVGESVYEYVDDWGHPARIQRLDRDVVKFVDSSACHHRRSRMDNNTFEFFLCLIQLEAAVQVESRLGSTRLGNSCSRLALTRARLGSTQLGSTRLGQLDRLSLKGDQLLHLRFVCNDVVAPEIQVAQDVLSLALVLFCSIFSVHRDFVKVYSSLDSFDPQPIICNERCRW